MILNSESKDKIEYFVREGYLSKDIYYSLWKSVNQKKAMKVLKEFLGVNELTEPKIWIHLINKWQDIDDIFEPSEILIFRHLIKQGGVIKSSDCKGLINVTLYQFNKGVSQLMDREIIDSLETCSREKILVLSPKFRQDVDSL